MSSNKSVVDTLKLKLEGIMEEIYLQVNPLWLEENEHFKVDREEMIPNP